MRGHGGADVFVFNSRFGNHTALGFQDWIEVLDFSAKTQVDAFSDLTIGASGADAAVTDAFGNSILLTSMAGMINETDFSFA